MSQTQLGLDPERKWTEAALAQKLGVIQQTINSWISDIRARQRANRKRASEIVGNANFGNIDTLLSQGHDMDYMNILNRSGWEITHIIDCPMSLRTGGHATVSGKYRTPDAKKPNPGDRSTFPDYRKKEEKGF